ncbi:hypothetical protein NCCP2140_28120 [Pseudoalteromonas sp. NCCP-2140]|uniref:AAA family ATPase n=1 Tax=Pseudoalteromonas sp. NCCP-2140 TaxID=2942288 RepID=UPI00203A70E1|nr:AAA family ATPase [Pseudoalteromonas sp. NCCP-2140]GKW53759.1 hypothetical protein NCCP2140_28120 [Pseudoalteromonas sp. NCCP-2140]
MRIRIRKSHKSIPTDIEFELPQFTVLTGENGSGKTHLFEAISDNQNGHVTLEGNELKSISYIPFGGLNPQVGQQCDPTQISKRVKQVWQDLLQAKQRVRRVGEYIGPSERDPILPHIGNTQFRQAILNISNQLSIPPSKLTEDMVSDHINMMGLSGNSLFNSQFALIFKTYHIRYLDNKLNKVYENEEIPGASPYLDSKEFIEKYGEAPWDFVNGILARLSLPYTVNNPMKSKRDSTFVFMLIHNHTGIEIGTNDLSTGEKTLMSLALAIYNSIGTGDRADFLILDEPDAPLHPSMSKLMLEIIEEEIVHKHGIPVLISTHSSTTIACTPASALYKITATEKVPTQCDFHDSMKILTYGIPNLRVSTEHRRQVFVEHTYDVEYYELFFDIISRKIRFETIPQFLPPHTHNGSNCDAVLEITRKLRDMGNSQVYGLIDWDLKNEPEEQVVILGLGRRYAIENYIFEPHFLGLYLIHKKFASPEELGLEGCNSYLEVISLISNNRNAIQSVVDSVQEKLFKGEETASFIESVLIDESRIEIDQRISLMKGHELEDLAREVWPQLNSVRSNNGGDSALKKDIIGTVINDFPGLVSSDVADTFRELV